MREEQYRRKRRNVNGDRGRPACARRRPTQQAAFYELTRSDKIIGAVLFIGFVASILTPFTFFAIRPGEVGVLYHLFGGGTETTFVYNEGIGVKWPWNTIYRYEVRTQAREEQ